MQELNVDKELDKILLWFATELTKNDNISNLLEATAANMKSAYKAKVLIKKLFGKNTA